MADLLTQYLMTGDLLGFLQAIYTSVMGVYFYGLLALFIMVPLYLRYQGVTIVLILMIILSASMYYLIPPSGFKVISIILVLGLGGLITILYYRVR